MDSILIECLKYHYEMLREFQVRADGWRKGDTRTIEGSRKMITESQAVLAELRRRYNI